MSFDLVRTVVPVRDLVGFACPSSAIASLRRRPRRARGRGRGDRCACPSGPHRAGPTRWPTTRPPTRSRWRRPLELIGAEKWWDAGYTGDGVDVAVIDTGVSPVEGLAQPGKIINGPDLSLESQAPNLAHLDTNGHGTFMAGLIAGHDSDLTTPYSTAPDSQYRGVAPDARIVNVKVGTADGGVDVSQVIAAIDWVVQHKDDNGMHIRVLNLSYGTNSSQDSLSDPLSYAAEQAWKAGIVVVAAAGNSGYQTGHERARPRRPGVQQLRDRGGRLRPGRHRDHVRRRRGPVLGQRSRLLRMSEPRLRGARIAHASDCACRTATST